MSSYPRNIATSREQLQVDRIAALEARLRALEVRAATGSQRGYAEALEEVSTTSSTYVDLGGPSITVRVEKGQLVAIWAEADLNNPSSNCYARVGLFEDEDFDPSLGVPSWSPQLHSPFDGSTGWANGKGFYGMYQDYPEPYFGEPDWEDFRAPNAFMYPATPGDRTYTLKYARLNDPGEVRFRNRRLWVIVV